jgi:thiol-disulfide isomerase/thioredoxin
MLMLCLLLLKKDNRIFLSLQRMRKACLFLLMIALLGLYAQNSFAQLPPDKKEMPAFKIQMTDSKYFTAADLKKNEPVILIYFSPTCDHCKAFTEKLLPHINELGKTQIVMVTFLPINEIVPFENEYHLEKYPNLKIGTEGYSFTVQKYYAIRNFPMTAVFNKHEVLDTIYRQAPDVNVLVSEVKKLK